MLIKTTTASFIAGIIHMIIMGIFARRDNINTTRV
ncbi:hypothetical protein JOD44_002280 [Salimicrobium jeotgali]|nr:hypothetical protein [Salimicrobium jeotgali]